MTRKVVLKFLIILKILNYELRLLQEIVMDQLFLVKCEQKTWIFKLLFTLGQYRHGCFIELIAEVHTASPIRQTQQYE